MINYSAKYWITLRNRRLYYNRINSKFVYVSEQGKGIIKFCVIIMHNYARHSPIFIFSVCSNLFLQNIAKNEMISIKILQKYAYNFDKYIVKKQFLIY